MNPPETGTITELKKDKPTEALDHSELKSYWERLHRTLCHRLPAGFLLVENNPLLVNRFDHFGHWLGMRANLKVLGQLRAQRVLDLGCGRGRWSALFSTRGAHVTGVDWSPEAIRHARRTVPAAQFRRMSITALEFPPKSFAVVNSVTVIQHLPPETHAGVLLEAARVLHQGGKLSLIELVIPQPGPHVFPRRVEEWKTLAESAGFRCLQIRGCSYNLVFRPYQHIVHCLNSLLQKPGTLPGLHNSPVSLRQQVNRTILTLLSIPSFPVEWMSRILPLNAATHAAMVFEKN